MEIEDDVGTDGKTHERSSMLVRSSVARVNDESDEEEDTD
jgi:hypothetical protein